MSARESDPPDAGLPDFSGKLVLLYVSDPSATLSGGILLEYAELKRLGGRLFVVGRLPDVGSEEWVSSLQGAVAWDSVLHYLVFPTREEYLSRSLPAQPPSLLRRVFGSSEG